MLHAQPSPATALEAAAFPSQDALINEAREALKRRDKSRLEALRSAVRVGVDDFEQGRYATFESGAQLRGHLASLASKAIAGA